MGLKTPVIRTGAQSWRKLIGFVGQEPVLFATSASWPEPKVCFKSMPWHAMWLKLLEYPRWFKFPEYPGGGPCLTFIHYGPSAKLVLSSHLSPTRG